MPPEFSTEPQTLVFPPRAEAIGQRRGNRGRHRRDFSAPITPKPEPIHQISADAAGSAPYRATLTGEPYEDGSGAMIVAQAQANASPPNTTLVVLRNNSSTAAFVADGQWVVLVVNDSEWGRQAMPDLTAGQNRNWVIEGNTLGAGDAVTLQFWASEPPA